MKISFTLFFLLLFTSLLCQETGTVKGKVTDEQTNIVLTGATIVVSGSKLTAISDHTGQFTIENVPAGKVEIVFSYVGYWSKQMMINVSAGQTTIAEVKLSLDTRPGSEVVVSASWRSERITNTPTSIQVIGAKEFSQYAGSNPYELVSKLQGVEYTRNGVTDITLNARGFHSAFNNKVFQMVDGRTSMASLSGNLAVLNRGSTNKDDIENMEVVLGPQSALYGPNAHNAVFNIVTKDPRKFTGTTASITAGNRYQLGARVRQAAIINKQWAYKLSGEYLTGEEYKFYDRVFLNNADTVGIPERNVDFNFRHVRGEGHIYYTHSPKAYFIFSGGGGINNWPQVTTSGRNQMRGVTYSFAQARFVHPRLFVNLHNTWGSIGSSYPIGTYTRTFWNLTNGPNRISPDSAEAIALKNSRFKEESQRLSAEAQYNYTFQKAGLFLVAGVNFQDEKPNGFGINLIDSFTKIRIKQYGAVLQLDKTLPYQMRFMVTSRLDYHQNFGNFFSPRFALLKAIKSGNFRVTWGRAFAMPTILNQYSGINRFLFGNVGDGIKYIRNGAKYSDPQSISYTATLKPEQVSTWEIGYKGTILKKLFLDVTYYNGQSKNFISPARTQFGRVLSVNGIPVTHNPANAGVVTNDTLRNANFLTYFNYAAVRAYGIDAGITYTVNPHFSISLKYSWFASDITKDDLKNDANKDNFVSLEETSLNAPNHRGIAIFNLQNLCKQKLSISAAVRVLQVYDFYSGFQIGTAAGKGKRGRVFGGKTITGQPIYYMKNFDYGPLGNFATIDLSANYQLNSFVNFNVGVTNLLNTQQIEFVGSPSIGRLIFGELRVHVPSAKKK